jgi:hypothetical protein
MDPKANIREQLELARKIQYIWDNPEDYGGISDDQLMALANRASELAELVIALDEWRKKGGFDPYAA